MHVVARAPLDGRALAPPNSATAPGGVAALLCVRELWLSGKGELQLQLLLCMHWGGCAISAGGSADWLQGSEHSQCELLSLGVCLAGERKG